MFKPHCIQLNTLSELSEEYNRIVNYDVNDGFFLPNLYNEERVLEFLNKAHKLYQVGNVDHEQIKRLLVQIQSYYIALSDFDFIQASTIQVSMTAPSQRDVIVWCEEAYIVESSDDHSAFVLYMDGEVANNKFYYGFEGEPHYIVGRIVV